MDYSKALRKQLLKCKGRKIVLMSEGVLGTFLMQTFEKMEIEVEKYLDFRKYGGRVLPEELQNKAEEYFIIVAIYSGHKRAVEELMKGGYRYNIDCAVSSASVYVDEVDMVDPLLAFTRKQEVCPGIVAYGDLKKENDLIILTLGNSTTDGSTAGLNCWSYYLFTELSKRCKRNVVVYNGGFAGYHSGQEFLKLCRDGLDLNPSVVVSFSGVTEIDGSGTTAKGRKLVHKYQWRMWQNILGCPGAIPDSLHMRNLNKISAGVEETMSEGAVWINNERKMYAICREYGIHFIGCLQPMVSLGCVLEDNIKMLLDDMGVDEKFYDAQRHFLEEVTQGMKKYDYIKDLTMLFDGMDGMYYDSMHYTEQGNQVIASAVADLIVDKMAL